MPGVTHAVCTHALGRAEGIRRESLRRRRASAREIGGPAEQEHVRVEAAPRVGVAEEPRVLQLRAVRRRRRRPRRRWFAPAVSGARWVGGGGSDDQQPADSQQEDGTERLHGRSSFEERLAWRRRLASVALASLWDNSLRPAAPCQGEPQQPRALRSDDRGCGYETNQATGRARRRRSIVDSVLG